MFIFFGLETQFNLSHAQIIPQIEISTTLARQQSS